MVGLHERDGHLESVFPLDWLSLLRSFDELLLSP
jgi:hypothetical protein